MFLTILAVAAAQATTPVAASDTEQAPERSRVICRRQAEIGTNIRQRKVCMTEAQWAVVQDGHRNLTQDLMKRTDGFWCAPDGAAC